MYNEFIKVVFDTLTERGENVDVLIRAKQDAGMDYDAASREVVAEAMTDILPDANFVEELTTKHKNIFNKLLDMLKEFVADLKAYFNSIAHNPSREANALKEQIGEGVKYLENIVKLFDNVAVEAVEDYQATVATEIDINNTDGGITNGTEQTESADTRGTRPIDSKVRTGTQSEVGNRSRVQETVGGQNEETRKDNPERGHNRGLNSENEPFVDSDYVTYGKQDTLINMHGLLWTIFAFHDGLFSLFYYILVRQTGFMHYLAKN